MIRNVKQPEGKSQKHCEKNNSEVISGEEFLDKKKQYRATLEQEERKHKQSVSNDIANTKDASTFWKVVGELKPKQESSPTLRIEDWTVFFKEIYKDKITNNFQFFGVSHPVLDRKIQMHELIISIKKSKNGQAPGRDGISNEFYKAPPENC